MAARFFEQEDRSKNGMPPSKRVALVVGNGDYPHARLPNARNDARLIASALGSIGFSTEVLIDAGKAALETAIVRLGERMEHAGSGAFGFFYFAGHGIQHEGINFILPVDADLPDVRYLRSGAVPVDLVIDEIDRGQHAEASVVALDACRDNRIPDRSSGPLRGLASMRRVPSGTIVAFATAADQVADDGSGGNSPFAASLSKRLVEPGRRLDEIFFVVARDVAAATGGTQQPSLFVQGAVSPIILHGDATVVVELQEEARKAPPPAARKREPPARNAGFSAPVQRFAAVDVQPEPEPRAEGLIHRLGVQIGAGVAALALIALIAFVAWLKWPSGQHVTSLLVVNDSRMRIDRVYVSREGPWGEDRLGKGTLPAGLGMRIQLKDAAGGCRFNVRVVYNDAREESKSGLDLCRTPEVVFSGP